MSSASLGQDSGVTELAFLSGGGEMGERMRAFNWSSTSLGPAEDWPQCLKTTVSIILRSPVAIVLLWGEDGIMIYNNAYSLFARARHPQMLGMKVREAWPEVAGFNDNVLKVVLAGGTLSYKDKERTLYRNGRAEQVYTDLDYSPVLDAGGTPAGVIAIVVETTERISAERRARAERERLQQLFEQAPGFMAMLGGREHVFELANPAYMQIVGHRDILGKSVREAFPEVEGQGYFELLDQVFETGEAYQGSAMKVKLQRVPDTEVEERYVDFVFQPILGGGEVTGIFVEGYDVTERVRGDAHLRLLMDELNHRLKNTLATVHAIVAQTLKGPGSLDEAREALSGRIMALSRAQDVLTSKNWYGATLAQVIEMAVAAHAGGERSRFHIRGPHVELGTRAALALSLALHELATNAAKYGALTTDKGQVGIEWAIENNPEPVLKLQWQESEGPPVVPPSRKGFGSHLMERGLAMEFDAEIRVDYAPSGLVFRFAAALASLNEDAGT
jgi:two-component sensor histidine kinase